MVGLCENVSSKYGMTRGSANVSPAIEQELLRCSKNNDFSNEFVKNVTFMKKGNL